GAVGVKDSSPSTIRQTMKDLPGALVPSEKYPTPQENLKNLPGIAQKSPDWQENLKNIPGGAEGQKAADAWKQGDTLGAVAHGAAAAAEFGIATASALEQASAFSGAADRLGTPPGAAPRTGGPEGA